MSSPVIHVYPKILASHARTTQITLAVLHATAGGNQQGAIEALEEAGCSYHYVVQDQANQDGKIVRLVPLDRVAYHSGSSWGPREQARGVSRALRPDHYYQAGCSVNSYSVGISLVNRNDGRDPYSDEQYRSVVALLNHLRVTIPTLTHVTTHEIVAPARKSDPHWFAAEKAAKAAGLKFWTAPK